MKTLSTTRRTVSVTMQQDLYEQLRKHCQRLDQPLTVFIREALKRALQGAD